MQLSSPAVPGLKKAGCVSIQCYKHKGLEGALTKYLANVSADTNKRHVSQLSSLWSV